MTRRCGTGAMACISRNCAPHGPHLSEKNHNTTAADRPSVPQGRYRHVNRSPNDCRRRSADAFHTCEDAHRSQAQPCLLRLWASHPSDGYPLGTQVVVICRYWKSWKALAIEQGSRQGLSQKLCRLLQVNIVGPVDLIRTLHA